MAIKRWKTIIVTVISMMMLVSCAGNGNYKERLDEEYLHYGDALILENKQGNIDAIGRMINIQGTIINKVDKENYHNKDVVEAYYLKVGNSMTTRYVLETSKELNLEIGDVVNVDGFVKGRVSGENSKDENVELPVIDIKLCEVLPEEFIETYDINYKPVYEFTEFKMDSNDESALMIPRIDCYRDFSIAKVVFWFYKPGIAEIKEYKISIYENESLIQEKNINLLSNEIQKEQDIAEKSVYLDGVNLESKIRVKVEVKYIFNGEDNTKIIDQIIN